MADIRLTIKASETANRLKEAGYFSAMSEAAVFAASYVLKNEYESFDPAEFVPDDSMGSNYAYGTLDPDGRWSELLTALYNTDTPRQYFRNLMVHGLETIGSAIERAGGDIEISEFV